MEEQLHITYQTLKQLFEQALVEAGLVIVSPDGAEETIGIEAMNRHYAVAVMRHPPLPRAISVSADLSWNWEALHALRTYTTEEDALVEFVGHADLETEPMYILVSVKLKINASPQFLTPVPTQEMWEKWRERVINPMAKLLPVVARNEPMTLPVAWQGSPTIELRTGEDWRQWYLSAIELRAYQEIVIPRHWDDPVEPEESPLAALTDLGGRVREALILFEKSLPLLGLSEEALRPFRKPDKDW